MFLLQVRHLATNSVERVKKSDDDDERDPYYLTLLSVVILNLIDPE
jgi:hypothetical protein